MVTSGSICSSRDMVFFIEVKWSVAWRCISLRQGPTQLARVVQLVQVVKLHLTKKGRGLINSYESRLCLVPQTHDPQTFVAWNKPNTELMRKRGYNTREEDDNMSITRSISVGQTYYRVLKANCYVDYSFYWSLRNCPKEDNNYNFASLFKLRTKRATYTKNIRSKRARYTKQKTMICLLLVL